MSKPADRRILGLSPRARRVVVPFLVVAAVLVVITYFSGDGSGVSSRADVGAERHAASDPEQRVLESGQGGAGHRAGTVRWTQHRSLDGKDTIGPSPTGAKAQAVGRARGLRR